MKVFSSWLVVDLPLFHKIRHGAKHVPHHPLELGISHPFALFHDLMASPLPFHYCDRLSLSIHAQKQIRDQWFDHLALHYRAHHAAENKIETELLQ
jgi:hypothetical protein